MVGALALALAAAVPAGAQERQVPPQREGRAPAVRAVPESPETRAAQATAQVRGDASAEGFVAEAARRDPPRMRLVEQRDGRLVYEVRTDWEGGLAEAVRRHGGDPRALVLAAVRGWATVSEPVPLGAFEAPAVEVLAADYDEVPLPPRSPVERVPEGAEEGFERLDGPAAEVVSVGEERRRPMGTLVARLLQVDRERGVVRRNRRLLIAVHTPAVPEGAAFLRGGASPHVGVTRSVLAEGTWFKIPIREEGIYRIDRAYLEGLGVEVAGLDPSRLQVYHNGGAMLPEVNSTQRPADLVENPVWMLGGDDGTFGAGDALLFYAEAPNGWRWVPDPAVPGDGSWEHYINYFSAESYVFLRVDGAGGARVGGGGFPGWPDAARQDRFDGRIFKEEDRLNLPQDGSGSGLEWFGEEVSDGRPVTTVLDTVPPGLAGGTVRWRARVAGRARPAVTMALRIGGETVASALIPQHSLSPEAPLGFARELEFEQDVAGGARLALDMALVDVRGQATGWLDWLEAVYPRTFDAHQGMLRFHTPGGQAGRFEFALGGFAAEPQVWDVTDLGAIRRLGVRGEGGRWLVQVEATDPDAPRELIAFEPSSPRVRTPAAAVPVPNQNLHGLAGYPDYVVVTHAAFREAAEDLAGYRRTHDGLSAAVVDVREIFNEFAGGMVDMRAVRDYMKFLYDRAPSEGELPRYLLLFGDGHYDYRGIEPGSAESNFVPVYETLTSLNTIASYTSDDYFGLLGDDEGTWGYLGRTTPNPERVDVGIGRLTVQTAEEAAAVVAKIRRYEDPATFGAWRSRFTFVADDAFPNSFDEDLHIQNADVVAEVVRGGYPSVDVEKVYTGAYPAVVTAAGRRIPEAAADIERILEEGTLIWNYSGHGGPEGLSDERVFTNEDVEHLDNFDRLTVFVTATCSFGRYDMVERRSGAELLLAKPDGGAVALLTTHRVVYTDDDSTTLNLGLNLRLTREMLERDADGRPRRLGDALRLTKNTDVGAQGNNHKFGLLGDPAMRLGLPERPVAITEVNGAPVSSTGGGLPPHRSSVLRANELAEVRGQVLTPAGLPDPAFDGVVEVVVFDAAREVELDPELYCCYTDGSFTVRTDRIYRGRATVRGGQFVARFVVPRDVSYSGLPGRISAYVASDGAAVDGVGATEDVIISPTAGPPLDDHEGPRMRLFLNDSTFVDGGLVGPEPTLIVRLSDEHGINTVGSGVGHDLLVTFDDDPASAVDVSRFYEGDLDSYQSGTVRFPLPEQAPGPHTLRVTAWDVANNSSSATLSYVLGEGGTLALRNVYNYPNPTPGPTRFIFEHNQAPGTLARVQLRIYTLAGRPVRTIELEEPLSGGLVQIPFDGLDEDFDRLASGVYLYRVRVAVDQPDGGTAVTEHVERLAVIR